METATASTGYVGSVGIYGFILLAIVGLLVGTIVLWKIAGYMGHKKPIALAFMLSILAVVFVWVFNWIPYAGWLIGPIIIWVLVKVAYGMRGLWGWVQAFITCLVTYFVTLIILAPLYLVMFVMYDNIFENYYYMAGAGIVLIGILVAILWYVSSQYKGGSMGSEGRRLGRNVSSGKSYR